MTQALTQQQAAVLAGLTTRRLQQLDKAGEGPARKANGSYPLAEMRTWIRDRILAEIGVANDGEAYDYNAERGRLTKAQADKTELEVAELQGSLIRVQAVIQHWQTKIAGVRAKLLTLPSKLAATVAPPDRLAIAQDQAQALVYDALADLAGDGIPADVRERAASIERAPKPARAKRAPKENQS